MTYLSLIKKTGRYRFQRGIPADLRPFFPGKGSTWRENLDTKDQAVARQKCLEISARVEKLFQDARRQLEASRKLAAPNRPPPDVIHRLVTHWKEHELYRRAQAVINGDPYSYGRLIEENKINGGLRPPEKSYETDVWMKHREIEDAQLRQWMNELILGTGYTLSERGADQYVFWNALRNAWFDIMKTEEKWYQRDYSGMPTTLPAPLERPQAPQLAPEAPRLSPKAQTTLTEALERWATPSSVVGSRARADRTIIEARYAVRRFTETHGDLEVPQITRRMAREFRDLLCRIPKGLPKHLSDLPIRELVELDLSDYENRHAGTINKTLNLLKAIVNFVKSEGDFDDNADSTNPFDIQIILDDFVDNKYEPFSAKDLNKLFSSPIFSDGLRPKQGRGETSKWLPLFALLHGARRGEILQLTVANIRKGDQAEFHEVSITTEGDKTVKTLSSLRTIPLHPKMVELGFLEHLERRRKLVGDNGSLWEGFDERAKLYGRSVRWSKWFHGYLAEHVVSDQFKKFHSFRGTFKRFGNDARVPEPHLDAICGHASSEVARAYPKARNASGTHDSGYSMKTLFESISMLTFNGVDFSKIQ
jgi:integrase